VGVAVGGPAGGSAVGGNDATNVGQWTRRRRDLRHWRAAQFCEFFDFKMFGKQVESVAAAEKKTETEQKQRETKAKPKTMNLFATRASLAKICRRR